MASMAPLDARYRMYRLMKAHDRSKIPHVEKVLKRYEGNEESLLRDTIARYGAEPQAEPVQERIQRFLMQYDEANAASLLPKLLSDYRGREMECLRDLHQRYGLEPAPPTPRAGGGGGGSGAPPVAQANPPQGAVPAQGPQGQNPPPGATAGALPENTPDVVEQHRQRLIRFYQQYSPDKMGVIEQTVQKYAAMEGGWEILWGQLTRKYGPEPAAPAPVSPPGGRAQPVPVAQQQQPASPPSGNAGGAPSPTIVEWQRQRLRRFYSHYAPDKMEAVNTNVEKYTAIADGFNIMWGILERKYGAENAIPTPPVPEPGAGGAPQPAQAPPPQAAPPGQQNTSPPQKPQSTPQQQPGSNPNAEYAQQLSRLQRYYAHYVPSKTVEEMEIALRKYADMENGFAQMWQLLESKYGAESAVVGAATTSSAAPVAAAAPAAASNAVQQQHSSPSSGGAQASPQDELGRQKARLIKYYAKYVPEKTEADIDTALARYATTEGGFPLMWETLERKYGPELSEGQAAAGTAWMTPVDKEMKNRLIRYYALYVPNKTDDEINTALRRYSTSEGGYATMWATLEQKYGPEPVQEITPELQQTHRERLRQFYAYYAPEKTSADIDVALSRYATAPGGFTKMWETLESKYGPESAVAVKAAEASMKSQVDIPSSGEKGSAPRQPAMVGGMSSGSTRNLTAADREGAEAFSLSFGQENVLHLVVKFFGADYVRYDKATTDKKMKFKEAVESDIARNAGLPPRQVRVTRFSAGSIVCEVDCLVPAGEDQQVMSEALVQKAQSGSFLAVATRESYRKELGGNSTQLYVQSVVAVGHPGSASAPFEAPVSGMTRSMAGPPNSNSFASYPQSNPSFSQYPSASAFAAPVPKTASAYRLDRSSRLQSQLATNGYEQFPAPGWGTSNMPQQQQSRASPNRSIQPIPGRPNMSQSGNTGAFGVGNYSPGSPPRRGAPQGPPASAGPPNRQSGGGPPGFGGGAGYSSPLSQITGIPQGGSIASYRPRETGESIYSGYGRGAEGNSGWTSYLHPDGTEGGFLSTLWRGDKEEDEQQQQQTGQQWRLAAPPYGRDAWSERAQRANGNPYAPPLYPPSFTHDHQGNPNYRFARDVGDGYGVGSAIPPPMLGRHGSPPRGSSPNRAPTAPQPSLIPGLHSSGFAQSPYGMGSLGGLAGAGGGGYSSPAGTRGTQGADQLSRALANFGPPSTTARYGAY